jgi:hypothetical protein
VIELIKKNIYDLSGLDMRDLIDGNPCTFNTRFATTNIRVNAYMLFKIHLNLPPLISLTLIIADFAKRIRSLKNDTNNKI